MAGETPISAGGADMRELQQQCAERLLARLKGHYRCFLEVSSDCSCAMYLK